MLLRPFRDMTFNVLHLLCPSSIIHAKCVQPAVGWDFLEAGLGEQKQCAGRRLFQPEFDERGRLPGVVYFGIDGIGVPGEGKEPLRLYLLYHSLPFDLLVTRIGNVTTRDLAGNERTIQFHAKPLAEFIVIGQRSPHSRNRRLEFDTLLNTVIHVKQPPGCILPPPAIKGNRFVAFAQSSALTAMGTAREIAKKGEETTRSTKGTKNAQTLCASCAFCGYFPCPGAPVIIVDWHEIRNKRSKFWRGHRSGRASCLRGVCGIDGLPRSADFRSCRSDAGHRRKVSRSIL